MAQKLDESTFDAYIADSELPVLADFYNDGCIPCKRISPIISRAEERYGDKINFVKVNCAMNPELVKRLGITGVPTLIMFNGKNETIRHNGVISAEDLDAVILSAAKGERIG